MADAAMDAVSLRQLRHFLAVSRAGSFTRAAGALHVSQPAVGLQVRTLEDALGQILFERHSRGVRLTPAGEVLKVHAEHVFDTLAEAVAALDALQPGPQAVVRLGVTPSIARSLLPALLLRAARPGMPIRLEFVEGVTETVIALLAERRLDAAFGYETGTTGLVSHPLVDERLCVVGPPAALGPGAGDFAVADLARLSLVLSPRPNPLRDLIDAAAAAAQVTLAPAVEINLAGLKRDFLLRYDYSAVSPRGLFLDDIRTGRLVGHPLAQPALSRRIYLHLSPALAPARAADLLALIHDETAAADLDELFWRSCP